MSATSQPEATIPIDPKTIINSFVLRRLADRGIRIISSRMILKKFEQLSTGEFNLRTAHLKMLCREGYLYQLDPQKPEERQRISELLLADYDGGADMPMVEIGEPRVNEGAIYYVRTDKELPTIEIEPKKVGTEDKNAKRTAQRDKLLAMRKKR